MDDDRLSDDDLLSDPCYLRLRELLQQSALNAIRSSPNDSLVASDKKCSWNQIKKSFKYSYQVGSRAFGLIDLLTDATLLYLSSKEPCLRFLTLSLVICMSSPYIISYSSGVQLFLFRQTFDNVYSGLGKLLMFLFLLPSGILYFVFLDFADICMHLFRWFYFVL